MSVGVFACSPSSGGGGAEESTAADSAETEAAATEGASGTASSGEEACTDPETMVLWAEDGEVVDPMAIALAPGLGNIGVARSWIEGMGTLTLEFTTACDGPLYVWMMAWDRMGGEEENADSHFITIDEGEEVEWLYGCNTPAESPGMWQWSIIESWTGDGCNHDTLELDLPAGDHSIVVRNREEGAGQNVAAIVGVVVSHDPLVDPLIYLDPADYEK